MPKKLPELVANRLFKNVFVCMKCNSKIRAQPDKVKNRKIRCRHCGSNNLRSKAKERRGVKA